MQADLVPEEWGGDVPFVSISAKKGDGIPDLLETLALVAEVEELQANPDRVAEGTVLEAHLDKQVGPVASLLVQAGTLTVRPSPHLLPAERPPCPAAAPACVCGSRAPVRCVSLPCVAVRERHRAYQLQLERSQSAPPPTWRARVGGVHLWQAQVVVCVDAGGCVQKGDVVQAGAACGRVRACRGSYGEPVEAAGPSTAVSVEGLDEVPAAGDVFRVFEDEAEARTAAEVCLPARPVPPRDICAPVRNIHSGRLRRPAAMQGGCLI